MTCAYVVALVSNSDHTKRVRDAKRERETQRQREACLEAKSLRQCKRERTTCVTLEVARAMLTSAEVRMAGHRAILQEMNDGDNHSWRNMA